jgi:CheY-like chemotaxis protein
MVVDDAPAIRQMMTRDLHGSGMEVMTAENGVVTDLDMSLMDRLALCRQLRAEHDARTLLLATIRPLLDRR